MRVNLTHTKNYNLDELVKSTCKLGDDNNDKEDDADEFESDDDSDDEETNLTEEFLSSRLGPKTKEIPVINLGSREVDINFNWHDAYKQYEQYGTLVDFENFIDAM